MELVRVRVPACGPRCLADRAGVCESACYAHARKSSNIRACVHLLLTLWLLSNGHLFVYFQRQQTHACKLQVHVLAGRQPCWEWPAWQKACSHRQAYLEVAHAPFKVLVGVQVVSIVLQHRALGRCISWCCCCRCRRLRRLQRHKYGGHEAGGRWVVQRCTLGLVSLTEAAVEKLYAAGARTSSREDDQLSAQGLCWLVG